MSDVDLSFAFKLPPEKAVEYFRGKGYAISFDWQDVLKEAHAKAFTVAKATSVDILQDIRAAVDKSLHDGQTFEQFRKELEPVLKAKGWWGKQEILNDATGELRMVQLGSPYRLRTIYQTNLQTSYMAGRYQAMMENTVNRPYWQYVAILDRRTRPAHRALNGRVFRFDDPIWDIIYPPNGWRCRCRVIALTEGEVKAMGLVVEDSKGKFTTTNRTLPDGTAIKVRGYDGLVPDTGWDYNVGKAEHQLDVSTWQKAKDLPREARKQFVDEMARTDVRDVAFSNWVNQVVTTNRGRISAGQPTQLGGKTATAGWLEDETAVWLAKQKGIMLENPIVVASDDTIFHAMRPAKHAPVALDELRGLPEILRSSSIYFAPAEQNIVFVEEAGNGLLNKYVVGINYNLKNVGRINLFQTAQTIHPADITSAGWEKIR